MLVTSLPNGTRSGYQPKLFLGKRMNPSAFVMSAPNVSRLVNQESGAYRTCKDGVVRNAEFRETIDDNDSSVVVEPKVPPTRTLSVSPGRSTPFRMLSGVPKTLFT